MSNKYPWSEYQTAVFDDVAHGEGHTVVDALAGSGKTSTIIESLEHIPDGKSWLLVAFNKRIAEELKTKAPMGGDIRTLHSLGLRAIYKKFPNVGIANDKVDRIMKEVVGKDKKLWDVKNQIKKTVSLCKAYLVDGDEFIDFIMDNHDVDTFEMKRDVFIEKVQDVLKECARRTNEVDFDDMIWYPHVHNLFVQKYHYVFVDEAQDLNNAQIALSLKACKRRGRIIALGDKNQAIYGFRGASSNAISQIKQKLKAKSLPLSITYRCPLLVTKEAQRYVPHIEAAPNAKDGIVDYIEPKQMMKNAGPGCFILSRTNAPLVSYALRFLKQGTPASIQGRDIGDNLLNLIKKSRRHNLENFLEWLTNWEMKEVARLREKNRDYDHIQDKAACLRAMADSCGSLPELKKKIVDLFEDTDEKDRVILSTVHKSKGLERDTVYVLWGTFRGGNREERNIRYVAVTRSKRELYYVT